MTTLGLVFDGSRQTRGFLPILLLKLLLPIIVKSESNKTQ